MSGMQSPLRNVTWWSLVFCSLILLLGQGQRAAAQSLWNSQANQQRVTFYGGILGNAGSLGSVTELRPSLGYAFNRHVDLEAGLPFYWVSPSSNATTNISGSRAGIGNAFLTLRLALPNPTLNYLSTLTGTAPTGDVDSGFSTGRATFDWNNHFDHTISRITPFANIGVANTISDTPFFYRPFSSLGLVGHLDGGARFRLFRPLSVGASAYTIQPSGQQKIYSKLLPRRSDGVHGSQSQHSRVFETNSVTIGNADIARDSGYSAWVQVNPGSRFGLGAGYNRSVQYGLNSFFFGITCEVPLLHRSVN